MIFAEVYAMVDVGRSPLLRNFVRIINMRGMGIRVDSLYGSCNMDFIELKGKVYVVVYASFSKALYHRYFIEKFVKRYYGRIVFPFVVHGVEEIGVLEEVCEEILKSGFGGDVMARLIGSIRCVCDFAKRFNVPVVFR